MEKTFKFRIVRVCSFLMNLLIGAIAVIAAVVGYAFIFESDNSDHDTRMGVFLWFLGILAVFFPNISFSIVWEFQKKEIMIFEILPMLIGGAAYYLLHRTFI